MHQALQIALAVEQAAKQDRFSESFDTGFEKSVRLTSQPRVARMQEAVGRGKLLTPERVAERTVSNTWPVDIEFKAPGTRRIEKR